MMDALSATPFDTDEIASKQLLTEGALCSVFIYEYEEGQQKVSLRSRGDADVSSIALSLGGGGHIRAAGAVVEGTVRDVLSKLLPLAAKALGYPYTDDILDECLSIKGKIGLDTL